jgi:hypothetical protein
MASYEGAIAVRLVDAIRGAGVAIVDVTVGTIGNPATVFVIPSSLQAAAQATINAFDWSDSAHAAWETLQARSLAIALLTNPADAYKLLRAAFDVARDEINILRAIVVGVGSAVWDPASIANGAGLTSPNVTVTGAAFGDVVLPAAPYTLQGLTSTGYVSAANTVNIRLENQTGAAINLASGTWTGVVLRYTSMPPRTLAQFKAAIQNRINDGTVDT